MTQEPVIKRWIETLNELEEFLIENSEFNVSEADIPNVDTVDVVSNLKYRLDHELKKL